MQKDTFKIVKARSLDDSDESCLDITCRLCGKTVNFAGTFENVRAKRDDFVNNHSCRATLTGDFTDDIKDNKRIFHYTYV